MSDIQLEHDWFPMRVPSNVTIGEGAFLHSSFAFLRYHSEQPTGVRIGRHTSIYQATMFELGPRGQVDIGDFCVLWQNVISVNTKVQIGNHCLIAGECYISDRTWPVPPTDPAYDPPDDDEPSIVLGDNCWIATRCALLKGARLGEGVIVGAGCVIDFEVPPFAIVAGNPAKIVAWAKPSEGEDGG